MALVHSVGYCLWEELDSGNLQFFPDLIYFNLPHTEF